MAINNQLPDDLESDQTQSNSPFPTQNVHIVRQGEWLSSIARQHGFLDWLTIWKHENNAQLREKRGSPNILKPGDVIYIPDKEKHQFQGKTGQKSRFKTPPKDVVRMMLIDEDEKPRAGVRWILQFDDGVQKNGATQEDGLIEEKIPDGVTSAKLQFEDENEEISLTFGELDPITTVRGLQSRL